MNNGVVRGVLCLIFVCSLYSFSFAAETGRDSIWFAPTGYAPDELQLFQNPASWPATRSRIGVVKFGPTQVRDVGQPPVNSYNDLVKVDAFHKLNEWGIAIAVEASAFDYTKCSPESSVKDALNYIQSIRKANGVLRYFAMQEPLIGGVKSCHLSFEQTLEKTTTFIAELSNNPELKSQNLVPEFGDIEPYPFFTVAQLEQWTNGLLAKGVDLKFFHLDVNINRLDTSHEANINSDFNELEHFFRSRHIPFGIIIWPGYDPIATDKEYYDRSLNWVYRIHKAMGRPDQMIYQSWVTRAGSACEAGHTCTNAAPMCQPADGPLCGKISVPFNLPENGAGSFSHTRLLNDATEIFNQPGR